MGWFSKKKGADDDNSDARSTTSSLGPPPSYHTNASTSSLTSSSASTYKAPITQQTTPSYGAPASRAPGANPYAALTSKYANPTAPPAGAGAGAGVRPAYGASGGAASYGNGPAPNRAPYGSSANPTRPEYGSSSSGSNQYGQTGQTDRELTAEEEEEEDVESIKREIRFVKTETVNSTRNALRAAQMAEESGRDTLERLGRQGEMLFSAEKHLDVADTSNRTAEEQARELKTLNRSMFAVHVKNPFNSAERQKEREEGILKRHEQEREQREATRQAEYQARTGLANTMRGGYGAGAGRGGYGAGAGRGGYGGYGQQKQRDLAARSKYQFEADESDDEKEREIEDNLDLLGGAAERLKQLALATSEEVDRQNRQIDGIAGKTDKVARDVHLNTERLKRIK